MEPVRVEDKGKGFTLSWFTETLNNSSRVWRAAGSRPRVESSWASGPSNHFPSDIHSLILSAEPRGSFPQDTRLPFTDFTLERAAQKGKVLFRRAVYTVRISISAYCGLPTELNRNPVENVVTGEKNRGVKVTWVDLCPECRSRMSYFRAIESPQTDRHVDWLGTAGRWLSRLQTLKLSRALPSWRFNLTSHDM